MTKIGLPLLAVVLLFAACHGRHSCAADLQLRERALAHALDSVLIVRDFTGRDSLLANLQTLRARELVLLDDARQCDFGMDVIGKNYWVRGRLKFPSRIELALEEVRGEK